MLTLTPVEAEVLANVHDDLSTLEELQDRLELRGTAVRDGTAAAVLWLIDKGLICEWAHARAPFYWPTVEGVVALLEHRRRARLVHSILSSAPRLVSA